MDFLLLVYKDTKQWHADTNAAAGGLSHAAYNYDNEDEAIASAQNMWMAEKPFRLYDVTNPTHAKLIMTHRHLVVTGDRVCQTQYQA